ncbi:MAG TPA: hypothetical protein HA306_02590 [Methanosarcina sp.]|nr:hypothetical protein [Methanosarcina sp.]
MEIKNLFAISVILLCLLFIPQTLAKENINISATENLNSELQQAVENYNQAVADKNSSLDDVMLSRYQVDLIVDQIHKLGMDVDFKQTSDVHVNNKGEKIPACISAEVKPYMLSKSYNFSSNNSTVLAEVWGTNITSAEFMEKVYPGSLEVLPEDIVKRLKNEPMAWPDPQKIQPGEKRTGAIRFTWLNYFSANPIKIHDLQYNSKI